MKDKDYMLYSNAIQLNNAYEIHITKKDVAMMSKLGLMIAATLILASATASAKTPVHDGYWHFRLTGAELAQMPNADDKACLAKADEKPYAVIACTVPQFDRIETRLGASYHAVIAKLPKAKRNSLRREQSLWRITREAICKARVGDKLSEASVMYTAANYEAAIVECTLDDLYRRTLWVERYR
jgi:uncharacterized protein YecT (DUF1311 family)